MGNQLWHRLTFWFIGLALVTMAVFTPMTASAQAYLDAFGNIQQRPAATNPTTVVTQPTVIVAPQVIQGYNYAFPAYAAPVIIRQHQPNLAPIQTVPNAVPANVNQCVGVSCPPVRY